MHFAVANVALNARHILLVGCLVHDTPAGSSLAAG
jgi:hypothetical protein